MNLIHFLPFILNLNKILLFEVYHQNFHSSILLIKIIIYFDLTESSK